MILTTLSTPLRDVVVEYSPKASWSSWEYHREGNDTHIFCGKFSLVQTKRFQKFQWPVWYITRALAVIFTLYSLAFLAGWAVAGDETLKNEQTGAEIIPC